MRKLRKTTKLKNAGFMMVEILVAVSIIAVSIIAAMTVAQKATQVARQALHTAQAAFLLEEGAENARIARDNAWSNMALLNSSEQIGIFTRTVIAASVNRNGSSDISASGTDDPNTKLITVTVSWPEGGETITKTLQLYIMNIFQPLVS